MSYEAVIFDLGGVVLGSPLHAIARYERDRRIPTGFINRVVVETGPGGAWSRLECGELELEAFYAAFERDCEAAGATISARVLMERVAEAAQPRPAMLAAVAAIRSRGLKAAALTNNWVGEGDGTRPLQPHFDAFIESSALGLRKPDPRIYRHTCSTIGVDPTCAVFLDDIGRNLKTARELGMTTIKVDEPEEALAELERVLGFPLRGRGLLDASP
ncbi:MAG: HAD family phosphatase [Myxococcales bacterium]|nr:HAD family phosphatase [Myxococcales bacterium]